MLLGDSGVGKTCLLTQFRDGRFLSGNYITTVGIDFRVRNSKSSSSGTKTKKPYRINYRDRELIARKPSDCCKNSLKMRKLFIGRIYYGLFLCIFRTKWSLLTIRLSSFKYGTRPDKRDFEAWRMPITEMLMVIILCWYKFVHGVVEQLTKLSIVHERNGSNFELFIIQINYKL